MRVIFLVAFLVGLHSASGGEEIAVENINVEVLETFNSFRGNLETLPAGWVVSSNGADAMSVGSGFRGVSAGSVTAGGCYAWDLGNGNYGLGYQPTANEFTPGFFMVAVSNATGLDVEELSISYDVICRNDQDRASSIDLELSTDGKAFVSVKELMFVSQQMRDTNSVWRVSARCCRMALCQALEPCGLLWLRWHSDDVSGSGSRDEIGIDNLRLAFHHAFGTVICIE